MLFDDRRDAGPRQAKRLDYLRDEDVVVVGLPRGGVPVAYEVARVLNVPLDVIVVRKLGVPYQPELAFGAIGEDGVQVINDVVLGYTRLTREEVAEIEHRERAELRRRTERLRRAHPRIRLLGRTVVVIDDGTATRSTARAACQVALEQGAQRVVLAVPVAPRGMLAILQEVADGVVCLEMPPRFGAVGAWYRSFGQVADAEVDLLLRSAENRSELPQMQVDDPPSCDEDIQASLGERELSGTAAPESGRGLGRHRRPRRRRKIRSIVSPNSWRT
ncbi:hypothetical protein IU483_33110 [Streptomyces gardneri]|nr:hypothetical protein [Streptomyces gardneri]